MHLHKGFYRKSNKYMEIKISLLFKVRKQEGKGRKLQLEVRQWDWICQCSFYSEELYTASPPCHIHIHSVQIIYTERERKIFLSIGPFPSATNNQDYTRLKPRVPGTQCELRLGLGFRDPDISDMIYYFSECTLARSGIWRSARTEPLTLKYEKWSSQATAFIAAVADSFPLNTSWGKIPS